MTAAFERLGWGVAPNPRHDLGTDLWLMARDTRLFDLGLVVGAQVKTGPSFFEEVEHDASGAVTGWWFRDANRRHIDAWLSHRLPHLLVLHNDQTRISYWAHVVEDQVVGTGKGAKLLVPSLNVVDHAHRDELLGVAATVTGAESWEGSAWSGAQSVPPSALWRHALLVPRLIAPHPNADRSQPVTPVEGLALLTQARVTDLAERSRQHPSVPSLADAGASDNWDWRMVGALGARLIDDGAGLLAAAVRDAPDAARRTAAAAAAAAAMIENGQAEAAMSLLDLVLDTDDAGPVDHAWLMVQRARCCSEVGRSEEARDLVAQVQSVGATHRGDTTATAIAGSAALILFHSSGVGVSEVSAVVAGTDTAASWWRTQVVARGLTDLTQRTFRAWARDDAVRFVAADEANNQLFSAALTASHAGDQQSWRHLAGLLAQDRLLRLDRRANPEAASAALETLRLAGGATEMKQAVRRITDDGPFSAVTKAAAVIDLDRLTRTTARASLMLLQEGGDVTDLATADRTAAWLLTTIEEPEALVRQTGGTFIPGPVLVDTLAAVLPATSDEVQRNVAGHLTTMPPAQDELVATSWARVVRALPSTAWTAVTAAQAGEMASQHHQQLQTPLRGVAALFDPAVRQDLEERAAAGSLDALQALGDVTVLPLHVVQAAVSAAAGTVRAEMELAEKGVSRALVHDHGHVLALLNVWHPSVADWPPLIQLIAHPLLSARHQTAACMFLAAVAGQVPPEVRGQLYAAAHEAANRAPSRWPEPFGGGDLRGPAAELAAALASMDDSPGLERLPALLNGSSDERQSAARIARRLQRPEDQGVLLTLAYDQDPLVRTAAARGLAEGVADGTNGHGAAAALLQCAQDPGRRVPAAVAAALSQASRISTEAEAVLVALQRHPSARVRRSARTPLDR